MTAPIHTYGPKCLLSDDYLDPAAWYSSPSPPKIRAQFFYVSSLPIDDPLSPLPPPSSGQNSGNERAPPQPFSARDNIALEEAWRELQRTGETRVSGQTKLQDDAAPSNKRIAVPRREHDLPRRQAESRDNVSSTESPGSSPYVPASFLDDQLRHSKVRANGEAGSVDTRSKGSWDGTRIRSMQASEARDINPKQASNYRKRAGSSLGHDPKSIRRKTSSPLCEENASLDEADSGSLHGNPSRDVSISGSPFIRAPLPQPQTPLGRSLESSSPKDADEELRPETQGRGSSHVAPKQSTLRMSLQQEESQESSLPDTEGEAEEQKAQSMVPVGVSRLHLVELPNLKMKPIYWSPLQDVSNALRSTWFYKNTMLPVETELANRLEDGYVDLKPWTETWQDELNSCVENGADAEEKIVYRLWPKEDPKSAPRPPTSQDLKSTSSASGAPEDTSDTATGLIPFDENRAAGGTAVHAETIKHFINASAIYVDATNAQILRPSLLPSVSRGRRPLSAIRKGRQIGIPVVRGFSRRLWDQLHPSKPSPVDVRRYVRHSLTRNMAPSSGQICYGCAIEGSRPTPSDLVLVIHGIGQKLSERNESWHFTHAINSFRSNVNMELNSDTVWPHVRHDHGGIMVLPVNWRSTLSLEDDAFDSPADDAPAANRFSLDDITPETIPAVRSLISDVMLDIPYYLSHHKPKMIQAVAKEANRVYRLWCKNNPGFQQHGRVHLIAHSLGSAMALDILSHQPTKVPDFDFPKTRLHRDIFEFDTKNLFICGSPAGFFLLLNKANLLPRRGRNKPGSEGDDRHHGVAGEAETYGCLAVDNLYNIMHTTDPIAYRVNAAVDNELASSLKPAAIPSASSSFWQSLSSVFRWGPATPSLSSPTGPATLTKLPPNVELETHDFTREEIAEKRMLLLNDNGQIDYFLSGGGGPLNIQYLNMLSAHSSYWSLTDFVRFVVVEVARRQGRDGALPAFRAEKRKGFRV